MVNIGMIDYPINDSASEPINIEQTKIKKRRKRKSSKQNPNLNQKLKKINIEQFISSDHTYDMNTYSDKKYENDENYENYENYYPEIEQYGYNNFYENGFNSNNNDYDFTIEELFEEMVCKVGDYFQNSINELIDNFCYDLLYILDDSSYIDDIVDSFCEELIDELKYFFQNENEKELPQIVFDEEDAESIFEPFSDPFFAVFLDAHDFSVDPPKSIYNKLRNIRSKVSIVSRETRKKLENSHINLTTQINQIDEIQNLIDRISIQNNSNLKHLEEIRKQNYTYLCQSKQLETEIELISIKSDFYSKTTNLIKKDYENYTNEDVKTSIELLGKNIQNYLDDQNSFKKDLSIRQAQLKKCRNNSNEIYHDFVFINGVVRSNLDKFLAYSNFSLDID